MKCICLRLVTTDINLLPLGRFVHTIMECTGMPILHFLRDCIFVSGYLYMLSGTQSQLEFSFTSSVFLCSFIYEKMRSEEDSSPHCCLLLSPHCHSSRSQYCFSPCIFPQVLGKAGAKTGAWCCSELLWPVLTSSIHITRRWAADRSRVEKVLGAIFILNYFFFSFHNYQLP